jgi:hypothetical protein
MLPIILLSFVTAQSIQMPYLGRPSTFINDGVEFVPGPPFGDGTIEFDIAMHGHVSFAGVAFRGASPGDYELIYLRPHLSRQPGALQYTPAFNGSLAWQLYSGDGYTATAELPLNRWVHVKLVVSGYSARLFLDGAAAPLLTATLKRPWARGQVGFWGGFGGANVSNLVVTPADTAAPAAAPPEAPPAHGVLTTWELSPAFETATVRPDVLLPRAAGWTPVVSESSGLVNIARYRASVRTPASPKGSRDLVFAKTTITAARAQRMKLDVAYSDAVHVFVNGRLLFAGDSAFGSRDPGFLGIASLGHDAIYVDLHPGANEIVLAVAENFGGWGFALRLEDEPEQLHNSATPQLPINSQFPTPKTPKEGSSRF